VNLIVLTRDILKAKEKSIVVIVVITAVKTEPLNGMVGLFTMTWKLVVVKEKVSIPRFQTGNLFQKTGNSG
jgi:hypothetical protein